MDLEVYGQKDIKTVTRLRLRKLGSTIYLSAVGEDGAALGHSSLLAIESDGTLRLIPNIDPALGFELTVAGKIAFHQ